MADSSNFCLCGDASVGPTKSTANSFTFAGCDGGQPVQISAANMADYIVSVIYGDSQGDPPPAGCYNVCYDGSGNRSISLVSSEGYQECILQEPQNLIGGSAKTDVSLVVDKDLPVVGNWGSTALKTFPLTTPITDFVPTHAELQIFASADTNSPIRLSIVDKFGTPVFAFGDGDGEDNDHTSFANVLVPVTPDGIGGYTLELVAEELGSTFVCIDHTKYVKSKTVDASGNDVDAGGEGDTGGGGNPISTAVPLDITYLKHIYNSAGQDQTIIEWNIDPNLASGVDTYNIYFDFGGNDIHTETVTHVIAGSFTKQRLIVNWNTLNSLRLEALVTEGANAGGVVSSNFGVTDLTIPTGTNETTVVV